MELLNVCHHLTSGIKTFAMEFQYYGIDAMRQLCGGAGFLLNSGIAQTWVDGAGSITFEGTPVVMNQQASRFIFV